MAIQHPKPYTIDEYEQFVARPENAERIFELINGEIIEKVPTEEHGLIGGNLTGSIWNFNREHKLGRVTVEPRHQTPDDRYNSRLPDVAFTSRARALPLVTQGAVPQMPDLAIEIKSPTDSLRKMRDKAAYYLANGAQLVWLVLPDKRLIEIYRASGEVDVLTENDTLDGEAVLPGFTLPVRDVFAE
jgi:Uma2 family endonuclease